MEKWMIAEIQADRLKIGEFVHTEIPDDETQNVLCPKCGTQIQINGADDE
jgi:hypothetical protein